MMFFCSWLTKFQTSLKSHETLTLTRFWMRPSVYNMKAISRDDLMIHNIKKKKKKGTILLLYTEWRFSWSKVPQRYFLLQFSYISELKRQTSLYIILLTNKLNLIYFKTSLHFWDPLLRSIYTKRKVGS